MENKYSKIFEKMEENQSLHEDLEKLKPGDEFWVRYDVDSRGKLEIAFRGTSIVKDKKRIKRINKSLWSGETVKETSNLIYFQFTNSPRSTPIGDRGVIWNKNKVPNIDTKILKKPPIVEED